MTRRERLTLQARLRRLAQREYEFVARGRPKLAAPVRAKRLQLAKKLYP